ncbi:molybdopterin-synthase adenylyltransferase MoeB [uncultured Pseudokineococcus sp.]|uniref:molybdopterin-synthase adenylyltransferase MoeB n=1 Tax=uncultured Pseudokineococcus sp. TaxID=1642928 RepID=UPI00262B902B|nr:molybdopterin-synthase adenylyltransferase MoeB [uncultured Pseudokineococcus sp.]
MSATSGPFPPLVAPGPPLGAERRRRAARHLVLAELGEEGQRRLAAARVLVVGAGGLGSPVVSYLAAAGVGTLGVVDDDVVSTSNLQRQVLHGAADVGRPKTASAADAVRALDPGVGVVEHGRRLADPDEAAELVRGYDLVVDGADNFPTRYLVADACAAAGVPEVWGSVLRWDGQVSVFWPGRGPTYRDLFPAPPPTGSVASCQEAGVLGAVCGVVGSVMAAEAVKLLTGTGRPLVGRVVVLDALAMSWRELPLRAGGRDAAAAAAPEEGRRRGDHGQVVAADRPGVPEVAPEDLDALLASGAAVVDVRGEAERAAAPVPGGVRVDLHEVLAAPGRRPAALEEGGALADLDAWAPVVVVCSTGVRSLLAAEQLQDAGFARVLHLRGGVTAWLER